MKKNMIIPVMCCLLIFISSYAFAFEPPIEVEESAVKQNEQEEIVNAPTCLSTEEVKIMCNNMLQAPIGTLCQYVFPQIGCFIHQNEDSNFCTVACENERFRSACESSCNNFIHESPGPYSLGSELFLNGACSRANRTIRIVIYNICVDLIKKTKEVELINNLD